MASEWLSPSVDIDKEPKSSCTSGYFVMARMELVAAKYEAGVDGGADGPLPGLILLLIAAAPMDWWQVALRG